MTRTAPRASVKTRAQPLRCSNCGGGLHLDDPAYGLTCPRCGIRVAGPFEDANEIPDYEGAPRGGVAVATIRFKDAASRRTYLTALRGRLRDVGYDADQADAMLRTSFLPRELIGMVFGRDDAERAVNVANEVNGVSAELGRTG